MVTVLCSERVLVNLSRMTYGSGKEMEGEYFGKFSAGYVSLTGLTR